uniref:Fibronectin type III domain containing 4 n=1 Tax=Rhinopithecus bieti TaxID=61621 RepID=A0A2K6MQ98_RHIBE
MSSGCHSAPPPSGLSGDMASLMPLSPYLSPTVLLLVSCDLGFVRADRPPSPVNVTVTHLRANSATVSWDVPEGNIVIGYSISQQRQNGPGQRVIREVNTTTRACALWGLAEDSDYTVQVRSIGLRGESPPGPRVHFRTLKGSDRLPSNSSSPGDITVEGLDGERPLQTGEVVIIVVVLLMWAAVIGLFCRQYDIIKDNDSNNNPKEKGKGPEQSPQGRPVGTRQVMTATLMDSLAPHAPILCVPVSVLPSFVFPFISVSSITTVNHK